MPRERDYILFDLPPGEYTWRGVRYLVVLFFGALLVAALVSPFVFWVFEWAAARSPGGFAEDVVEDKGFAKVFDRVRWIPVVLLLPWVLRRCGLTSWAALGLRLEWAAWRPVLDAFGLGLAMLVGAAVLQALAVGLEADPKRELTASTFAAYAARAALAGLVLGLLEEVVFRGLIFRMFYTALRPGLAVLASALFFALVHFKDVPEVIWDRHEDAVHLGSGFVVAAGTLASFAYTVDPVELLNTALVGAALCLLFIRSRSLWPCVGLHAGWIWVRLFYGRFVEVPGESVWWGTETLVDGLLATALLGALTGWLWWQVGKRDERGVEGVAPVG